MKMPTSLMVVKIFNLIFLYKKEVVLLALNFERKNENAVNFILEQDK